MDKSEVRLMMLGIPFLAYILSMAFGITAIIEEDWILYTNYFAGGGIAVVAILLARHDTKKKKRELKHQYGYE